MLAGPVRVAAGTDREFPLVAAPERGRRMPDRSVGGVGLGLRAAGRIQKPAAARTARPGSPFLPWLVALVALSLMVSLEYSRYLFADSYYDLYAGRYIVRHGIPHHNVVTVVAHAAPWIDHHCFPPVLSSPPRAPAAHPPLAPP